MEFFNNAKAVRLRSHLEKYLVADEEQGTVRQSHDGALRRARWRVERVDGNPHVIRLKSAHGGLYLAASDESYLLGMTGKKVLLQPAAGGSGGGAAAKRWDAAVEWEPIKEGYRVKLRTRGGKFLRANGATPPWRNSVTHDLPHRTATQDWVMWDVDVVDVSVLDEDEYLPDASAAAPAEDFSSSGANSPMVGSPAAAEGTSRRRSMFAENSSSGTSSPMVGSPAAAEGISGRRSMLADYSSSGANSPRAGSPAAGEGLRKSIFSSERWRPSIASERSISGSNRQNGMEFFSNAKAVRLQSHLGKYLLADDDETTVRQSRNGASSRNARWAVELVDGKPDRLRLRSCHGLYLTAAEDPFLLGMTGKKVLQTLPENPSGAGSGAVEWRPVRDGPFVKLMTEHGKFLRANGGAPPWRNSVTHDVPHRTATQSWVLWGVEIVDINATDAGPGWLSSAASFDSVADDFSGSPESGSPVDRGCGDMSIRKASGIDLFKNAKSVRLRSHHNKYLTADSDEEHVIQDRSGSKKSVKWGVEFVEGSEEVIRLRSCYGRYLRAEDEEFLLGVTGRRVAQALPRKLDSSVEWEPVRDGMLVKLKTRYGNYLRANGGLPPWRNSITHDIPHRHHGWILWEVDVVEIRPESPPKAVAPMPDPAPTQEEGSGSGSGSGSEEEEVDEDEEEEEGDLSSTSFHLTSEGHTGGGEDRHAKKSEGRLIYYCEVDDDGNFSAEVSFQFRGYGLEDLTEKLEDATGLEDVIVCSRNVLNGKLYPLRLALPPNNATMHVVVVPPTSKVANEFLPPAPSST